MSTRWYPLYQRGGPQLRVFLPNFWMKLVRPEIPIQKNVVQFACSMEMTKYDIRNYLEKIYNVKVVHVRTRIALGPAKRHPSVGFVTKEEDTKYAYVTLPRNQTFEFPDLFPTAEKSKKEEAELALKESKKTFKEFEEKNKGRPNMPGWFTI